jgi:predicted ATPase/transcriptional regulator with XRE-family HTH domain
MGVLNTPNVTQNVLQFANLIGLKMVEQISPVIFNHWLKQRRKTLDMTQGELANRVGCSVGALRKIESGERRPSKQLAGLLAEALELPIEERPIFIRVARGELNIERLRHPQFEPLSSLSEHSLFNLVAQGMEERLVPATPQIPLPTTPLIGRELEISALEKLFKDPQCRLLTLTGIGGIGKTRLAIEFALKSMGIFPGGIYYIPLSPVKSAREMIATIADVLDFRFFGSTEPKEQLINHLANGIKQDALLVFDNLEHLLTRDPTSNQISGAAELVSEFLQRLPTLKILGTSRERMNLHGEWMYELHGLSVPPKDYVGRLDHYDSIELFIKSAQRIKTDFQVLPEDQNYLMQVCQLVDGVPLAIELAAAWVSVLSCQEIAQEIKANLDFLSTSMMNIPERHRSIRATFNHSWSLLPEEERRVLCQLSVFRGGFDRKAAEQITGAKIDLLASLTSKSLVHRTEAGGYDLHEVIRKYALDYLNEDSKCTETYLRHCQYYLTLVRSEEKSLKSASQQDAVRCLTGEIDNIRSAYQWAINHKDFDQLGSAVRGFGWYYEITGLYREGIEQLELLVQALNSGKQDDQWCRILGMTYIHQALLYFRKGEFERAQTLYEDGIAVLSTNSDQDLLADAMTFLGTILHLNGDYARSRHLLEKGLSFALESKDKWFEAFSIFSLGYTDSLMGNYMEGYQQMLVGSALWREIGDPQSIAMGLNFMVPTLIQLGRYDEAKIIMLESIALCEQSKNRWGLGTAYRHLGLACIAASQFEEARAHILKSLEIFGEFAEGWDIAKSQTYLGDIAMKVGNFPEAHQYYQDAMKLSLAVHAFPIALDALLGIGSIQMQSGEMENALMFFYFILNHPASEEETKKTAEKLIRNTESTLSTAQKYNAYARAKTAAFEQFLEFTS